MKNTEMKIPALRFPEFEGEWEEKKLGKILISQKLGGNYANSGTPNCNPLVKMGNLDRGFIKLDKVEYIKEGEILDEDDLLKYGDLLFNTRNTLELVGKVAIWKGELDRAYYNSNILRLKFGNNFFMNALFNTPKGLKALRRLATGTTSVAAIYTNDLIKLGVLIPSLPEQKKIANFLSAVDKRLQLLKDKKIKLEEYKRGVMQRIFSQELRFTRPDGSAYPDWEEKKLGEITEFIRNGLSLTQNNENEGYRLTRIETISDSTINMDKVGYVKTDKDISSYILMAGDILFSNINSVAHIGKTAFISKDITELYHGMNLLCIRTSKKILPQIVYYYLNTIKMRRYFQRICSQAVNQASINQTELSKTVIHIPSCLDEQHQIATFLSSIDDKISLLTKQIESTEQYKKGLLQQMFV